MSLLYACQLEHFVTNNLKCVIYNNWHGLPNLTIISQQCVPNEWLLNFTQILRQLFILKVATPHGEVSK